MRDQDLFLSKALIQEGAVTQEQVDAAQRYGDEHSVDLTDALVKTETLTNRQIALVNAEICEVPFVELADYEPCRGNLSLVPRNTAERYCAFPLFMIDGVLTVAMDNPMNLDATDHIRQICKCEVDPVLGARDQIRALIAKVYNLGQTAAVADEQPTVQIEIDETEGDDESSQPILAAVNQILSDAAQYGASDIHINPDEHELHLRYRIDGVLQEKQAPALSMHSGIVQRLKVMARLDLTQRRRPQDGKFRIRHNGVDVDVRMSTVPTVCGENVVLRLLANATTFKDFAELGMTAAIADELDELLKEPNGMLLVTGPTGSGKTTTLYTAISKLNDPSRNVMTIEDPVEIRLPYVRQVQVDSEIGLTFASTLRSLLRQDPDVVLVGEIRDNETASIALQAALTGHLVLSTLHTNDAVGAIARLRDYGLPPFVLNSSLLGVVAQRLVRRVCQHCVVADSVNDIARRQFGLTEPFDGFVRGKGCNRCGHTGYRGRLGIYEFVKFAPKIRHAVEQGLSTDQIRKIAMQDGARLMWQDGLDKARLGQTTLAEVAKTAAIVQFDSSGDGADERISA